MNKVLMLCLCILLVTTAHSQKFKVVGNSRLAKIIGRINGERDMYAVTIGKTIFVSCKKEEFFAQAWWVKHEVTHVQQYKQYGILGFLKQYLFYSLRYSYSEIPFEKEAIS